ncbi:MAG: OB-fold nucleic acid binding domain-containing protein [Nitrososphaerota archaeon]|nr:OB-fold nucleic acid binding domain-containing protein [Nitrososphaerota archaeon]
MLKQKPELDESTLLKLIDEKKKSVGGGYLTDTGAIFLVAADLGVSLEYISSSDLTLKDIYIGANEITVVARVFAIYPTRQYSKKDGSKGYFRTMIVFDKDTFVKTILWDDKTVLIERLGIVPNKLVRVVKGYVKSSLDGRAILNVGARGTLELVKDDAIESRIPTIESLSKGVGDIKDPGNYLVVEGFVRSPPRTSNFTRADGTTGTLIQIYLGDATGKDIRVAIWSMDTEIYQSIPLNSSIRLVNLRAKLLPHGELELHGDESTTVYILPSKLEEPSPKVQPTYGAQTVKFRILSIGPSREDEEKRPSASTLVIDSNGNFYTLVMMDKAYHKLTSIKVGSVIRCEARRISPTVFICDTDSLIEVEDDISYPNSSTFKYKIGNVKDCTTPVFLEVIALSRSTIEDITTRDGAVVKRAEVIVGDETGEIRLVAWRDLTRLLEGIMPGQRLRIEAAVVKMGKDGAPTLQLKSYSSIKKIS